VAAVDRLLGLRQAYLDKRFDRAVDAVRDGVSNRKFATLEGMSRSAAQRLMQQARTVLVEIGELND
jgi:transposase